MTCQTCGKRYRLRATLSYTTAHLFSANSFHAYLEFVTIFLTTAMMIFSLVLTHRLSRESGGKAKNAIEGSDEKWIILPLFSLVMVMVALTARKIYQRWKRQQVVIKIDEIV